MRLSATGIVFLLLFLSFAPAQGNIQYPLGISPDGRALVDATGTRLAFNATTPWHLLARLTREETITFLDARAAQRFDAMLVSLIVSDGYNTGSVVNAYGEPPFTVPGDFLSPNEAYFAHVDWVLDRMEERGITAFLMPVYLGYQCNNEGWCVEVQAAGAADLRAFGRYVGQRYRDQPNIVWVHGGDVDAGAYGVMDETDALVEGIREFDADHLHTAHCSRFNSGLECYDRPWMDFNTTYSSCDLTTRDLRDDYQRVPVRPTVYIEGRYEAEFNAPVECIRSQAYWATLGGASGHFYGNGDVWDFPSGWQNALDSEGADSMFHHIRLLASRGAGTLVPDYSHTTVVSGYGTIGTADYVAAALRPDRRSLVAYLPTRRTITVAMDRISGVEAEAWWIDPQTGAAQDIGRFATVGTRNFTPPLGSNDWLLVIDDASADLVDVWEPSTDVAPDRARGVQVRLVSVAPNPFNPRTSVEFVGPQGSALRVAAYDARGREVAVLFDGPAEGTVQHVVWEPRELASGIYYVRVIGDGVVQSAKVAVLK